MNIDQRDSIDLGRANIPKLFAGIFVPTLLGMLFNAAFNITDGIFIGHGVGSNGLAAVNIVAPLFMISTGVGLMMGIGASVVASIHLSQGNTKAANINITQSFLSAVLVLTLTALIGLAEWRPIVRLFGCTQALEPLARDYFVRILPCLPLLAVQIIGLFVIRLDGSPTYAMLSEAIPAVVNMVLDYVFIFPLNMGLKGAAIATDLGTLCGALMVTVYMIRLSKTLHLYRLKRSMKSLLLTLRNVGYMCRVGFSGLLNELSISLMMLVGNWMFIAYLGEDGVAAFSIVCYLFPLIFTVNNAVAQSAQPIISYNYGQGKTARVKEALRFSLLMALLGAILIMIVLNGMSGPIVQLFAPKGTTTFDLARHGLPLFSVGIVFYSFNMIAIGYMQSIKFSKAANYLTFMRGFALLTLVFILLPRLIGSNGLWLAIPVTEVLTSAAVAFILLTHTDKHLAGTPSV